MFILHNSPLRVMRFSPSNVYFKIGLILNTHVLNLILHYMLKNSICSSHTRLLWGVYVCLCLDIHTNITRNFLVNLEIFLRKEKIEFASFFLRIYANRPMLIFFTYVCTLAESCAQGSGWERDHWGDPDVDGRIILKWIFRKWEGVVGTGWS